jgi:hypothetical protein
LVGIDDIEALRGAVCFGGSAATNVSDGRENRGSGGRSFCRTSTLCDLCFLNGTYVLFGTAVDMMNMLLSEMQMLENEKKTKA